LRSYDQDIAGVNIGMTQDKVRRLTLKGLSELFGTPDEIKNLSAFGPEERSHF